MGTIAIVPARAGSKGIPGKNIKPLCGKPLLAYTAEVIRAAGIFDRALLSTDSEEIAEVGRAFGLEAPFLRPKELARDDTPMLPVIENALSFLERGGARVDIVVLLQPTQPLRTAADVVRAVDLLKVTGCDSVASVVALPPHMCPDYVMRIDEEGRLVNFLPEGARMTRRQDVRPAYVRDGTVYAFRAATLRKHQSIYGPVCLPLIIDKERSVNLDSEADWQEAERRLGCV
jgi:CMP-N,N'-diacetyllegionaminic acid synthase